MLGSLRVIVIRIRLIRNRLNILLLIVIIIVIVFIVATFAPVLLTPDQTLLRTKRAKTRRFRREVDVQAPAHAAMDVRRPDRVAERALAAYAETPADGRSGATAVPAESWLGFAGLGACDEGR